jgi:glycosyltransferase involved in cell wall biosynthesis
VSTDRRTTVVHVLNSLQPSGAEVMLRTAQPVWAGLGIATHVVSTGTTIGPYADALREAGCEVSHVPVPGRRGVADLVAFLRRGRFTTVHVHTERAGFAYCLAARASGARRVVRTFHNVFGFEGALRRERTVQRALTRSLGVVGVSVGASVRQNERERFRNPTRQIDNWADVDRFQPVADDERERARDQLAPGAAPVVLSVGNCATAKNHEQLLEALAAASLPPSWLYLHAGSEATDDERRLAERLGIADHVRFLGRVADPVPLMQATDVFAMPSLYEGMSIAALEAIACGGLPLLTDVPGLRDLRPVAPHAVWAAPETASLATALGAAAERSVRVTAADRAAAHARVVSTYSPEVGATAYASLYLPRRRGA